MSKSDGTGEDGFGPGAVPEGIQPHPFAIPIKEVVAGLMQYPADMLVMNVGALIFLAPPPPPPPPEESLVIKPSLSIVKP